MSETTIDGYPVTQGMRVWDYDLRPAIVGEPNKYGNPSEPTWYEMTKLDGSRSSSMDAKRMWYRHPSTRKTVDERERTEEVLSGECWDCGYVTISCSELDNHIRTEHNREPKDSL